MQRNKRYFWLTVIFILLVVLPLVSYLLVKEGYSIRENVQPSSFFITDGEPVTGFEWISHRGDTLTPERLKDNAYILEFIDAASVSLLDERHPLFEIQESYKGKTRNLRIISVWADSSEEAELSDLQRFAHRYAVRENWHVVIDKGRNSYRGNLLDKQDVNSTGYFPGCVYLIDKSGKLSGIYDPGKKNYFSALFTDVLYLVDQ